MVKLRVYEIKLDSYGVPLTAGKAALTSLPLPLYKLTQW